MVSEGEPEQEWKSIEFIDWIQFNQKEGKMKGSPIDETVLKSFEIKIKVSDGYKEVEGQFIIRVTPTLMLIMEVLFQFGSAFAVVLGAWKYKDEIHAILFKKRFKYDRDEVVCVNQKFRLEIPIIRLELEQQNEMCKFMKMKGLKRLKEQRLIIYKDDRWISSYFRNCDF